MSNKKSDKFKILGKILACILAAMMVFGMTATLIYGIIRLI